MSPMALITSDLHFTHKPEDAYRFGIFDWLFDQAQKHKVESIYILGDITDAKDKHPASLVNNIVLRFDQLASSTIHIFILKGNHDYVDADLPYFEFLDKWNNVHFYKDPVTVGSYGRFSVLMLPHTNNPYYLWASEEIDKADYVFLHQTVDGSLASNGHALPGMPRNYFKRRGFRGSGIFSGDVHVPQVMGDVTYVGSPYHVHYGDSFVPRVLLLDMDTGETSNLSFPAPQRRTINVNDADEINLASLRAGDYVKVRVWLDRHELVDWERKKREVVERCKMLGLNLGGLELKKKDDSEGASSKATDRAAAGVEPLLAVSPGQVFDRFAEREKVDPYTTDVGKELLQDED